MKDCYWYLESMHFIDSDRAIADWNRGNLDALVVATKDAPALIRDLHGAALSQLKSVQRKDQSGNYVLITR